LYFEDVDVEAAIARLMAAGAKELAALSPTRTAT